MNWVLVIAGARAINKLPRLKTQSATLQTKGHLPSHWTRQNSRTFQKRDMQTKKAVVKNGYAESEWTEAKNVTDLTFTNLGSESRQHPLDPMHVVH
ncbi:hypothetical protein BC936DRAFT_142579 [Jimgerdemannia flammicorona]|uniref:Uncharacterized protein n=1 Tax=Jimgerdemannia flammicorona TaxID=994334 RepID=A0A433A090_9FUNG|nr:hypothetical protein BC936DRAFT_142579 [Jimgerdemannia flammicorona]